MPRSSPAELPLAHATAHVLGVASAGSGALFVMQPERCLELVQLPRNHALGRAIGVRDVVAGLLLLAPETRRKGLALRAFSDAFDGGLALSEIVRGRRPWVLSGITLLGALGLGAIGRAAYVAEARSARQ